MIYSTQRIAVSLALMLPLAANVASFVLTPHHHPGRTFDYTHAAPTFTTTTTALQVGQQATELPDSLQDAAVRAAEASAYLVEQQGPTSRCRVDFDTSVGDETFPLLKTSAEFMQQYVTFLCNAIIPGLQQERLAEMQRVAEARAALETIDDQEPSAERDAWEASLVQTISRNGRLEGDNNKWQGPKARIYFPDEGNAALARRDWIDKVPACVEFAACGGVQSTVLDVSQDMLVFFYCPKASEAESVEEILLRSETGSSCLQLSVMINPNLVDMGVTGFGMAGRMLRERLIDPLVSTYYLRTLPWGALTRKYPDAFSVWQEDAAAEGGYRLIQTMDRLPSNPEVEDIYDIENGLMEAKQSGGLLDQFGDFVNGMMRL